MSKTSPAVPEPSSTIVLVRDSELGLEVFLQQRHHDIPFLGGAHVFPGGKVEASDQDPRWQALSPLSVTDANATLGLSDGGLAYWIAAIRECYEESGILMAVDAAGKTLPPNALGPWPYQDGPFLGACEKRGVHLSTPLLTYYSHWITPTHLPKRFDTRFFIARAPEGQPGSHDGAESIDSIWITPAAALELQKQRKMTFAPPTFYTLKFLLEMSTVDEAILNAQNNKPTRAILPIFRNNRLLMPGDPGYDEPGEETV